MQVTASRQWFYDTGTTIAHWAAAHGFSQDLAYAVISGRLKGTRGDAFRIREKLAEMPPAKARRDVNSPGRDTAPAERS